jgi:hypothetical protein
MGVNHTAGEYVLQGDAQQRSQKLQTITARVLYQYREVFREEGTGLSATNVLRKAFYREGRAFQTLTVRMSAVQSVWRLIRSK